MMLLGSISLIDEIICTGHLTGSSRQAQELNQVGNLNNKHTSNYFVPNLYRAEFIPCRNYSVPKIFWAEKYSLLEIFLAGNIPCRNYSKQMYLCKSACTHCIDSEMTNRKQLFRFVNYYFVSSIVKVYYNILVAGICSTRMLARVQKNV